jgi:hypothetical protein
MRADADSAPTATGMSYQRMQLGIFVDLAVDPHQKARGLQVSKMLLKVGGWGSLSDVVFALGRSLEHQGTLVGSRATVYRPDRWRAIGGHFPADGSGALT